MTSSATSWNNKQNNPNNFDTAASAAPTNGDVAAAAATASPMIGTPAKKSQELSQIQLRLHFSLKKKKKFMWENDDATGITEPCGLQNLRALHSNNIKSFKQTMVPCLLISLPLCCCPRPLCMALACPRLPLVHHHHRRHATHLRLCLSISWPTITVLVTLPLVALRCMHSRHLFSSSISQRPCLAFYPPLIIIIIITIPIPIITHLLLIRTISPTLLTPTLILTITTIHTTTTCRQRR